MFIKDLQLENYRNYEEAQLQFLPGVYIVKGPNGQGKSNFLESIYNLCTGRSYRTTKDLDLVLWNKSFYRIRGTIYAGKRLHKLEIGYEVKDQKKQIKINGIKNSKLAMMPVFPVIFFVPEDLELIRRGPNERRRFLDREICQTNSFYADYLSRYNKILLQKNKILRDNRYGKDTNKLLRTWNEQIIHFGSRIIVQRKETVAKWDELANGNFKVLFGPGKKLQLVYKTLIGEGEYGEIPADLSEVEETFYHKLSIIEKEELKRGYSLLGPHRDDLLFLLEEREAKRFASHGQQRSIIIALKAAQIQIHSQNREKPLFLLDDVFSELDEERRQQCFSLFDSAEQVFLTITKKEKELEPYLRSFSNNTYLGVMEGKIRGI
ncbi:MAG: DNA replication/repair protein RecF [Dethiobacteria bacterium]